MALGSHSRRLELEHAVQELLARHALMQLPRRYSRGVDRRDWELVLSCFDDDAHVDGSRRSLPVKEYMEAMSRDIAYYPVTMHSMHNQLVELDDLDHGVVESYGIAYHFKAEHAEITDPENLILGVRYIDRAARRDDGWRIVHRRVERVWRLGEYPATWARPADDGRAE